MNQIHGSQHHSNIMAPTLFTYEGMTYRISEHPGLAYLTYPAATLSEVPPVYRDEVTVRVFLSEDRVTSLASIPLAMRDPEMCQEFLSTGRATVKAVPAHLRTATMVRPYIREVSLEVVEEEDEQSLQEGYEENEEAASDEQILQDRYEDLNDDPDYVPEEEPSDEQILQDRYEDLNDDPDYVPEEEDEPDETYYTVNRIIGRRWNAYYGQYIYKVEWAQKGAAKEWILEAQMTPALIRSYVRKA